MTCDEAKPLMFESWSHALGGSQERAFEAHLESCETCRVEAERLGSLWNRLKMVPVEEPSVNLRSRFHETLAAYQVGLESAPRRSLRDRILSFWPKQPAWQMGVSFALLVIGLGVGYSMHPEKHEAPASTELAQLRGEISSMRQMVALSLMQEQSASERLRGVSWAYRVPSTDTEVLSALLTTVDQDPNVNVRLAAVDALHGFGASPVTRSAITQAIGKQTTPLVQIALIDLLVDLKEKESVPELRALANDSSADAGVRQHASQALEKLQ